MVRTGPTCSLSKIEHMGFKPKSFISEPIEVSFDSPPALIKKPGCPGAFTWRAEQFQIVEMISEWHDYDRRGRMAHNMRETHAHSARRKGSWGVGQDYYRVQTHNGRFFDLYFDRAPKDSNHRQGGWFLDRELINSTGNSS